MLKRRQNHVAESRMTLPVVMTYAIAIWMLSGTLLPDVPITSDGLLGGAWVQFACFLVSVYLLVELNNGNALIRIFSRSISCSFIILTCAANFLFENMGGAIAALCYVAFYAMLFHSYQDKQATGWTFYAFLCIGLCSTVFIQILYFLPLLWLIMFFQLSSFSGRTFVASILGLITPYWFLLPIAIWQGQTDLLPAHFMKLADFPLPGDYSQLAIGQILVLLFVVGLGITGIVHFKRNQSADNIRIRLLYGCFIQLWCVTFLLLCVQPQHFDVLLRLLIINTAPLIGHFLALTHTRVTNIAFHVIVAIALLLTILNLWMPSLTF